MAAIPLMFDAFALRIVGEDLEVILFTKNLGDLKFLLPLDCLAEFLGAMADAFTEKEE